jgi:hypothetical protein
MNTMNELDRLLSRVIDREDDAKDWHRLRELADGNPQVWNALADGLEDDRLLRAVVTMLEPDLAIPLPRPPRGHGLRWLGPWVAALVLAALWLTETPSPLRTTLPPTPSPLTAERTTTPVQEPLPGEMPRLVVATGDTAADGSVEVVVEVENPRAVLRDAILLLTPPLRCLDR